MSEVNSMGPSKIGRALFAEALKNFNKDRFVLLFPFLAFVFNAMAFGGIVIFVVLTIPIWVTMGDNSAIYVTVLAVLMTIFAAFTHVIVQASVMAAANQRYSGQTPTFSSAMKEVGQRLGTLSLFGLLEATVGMVLRAIRDNLKGAGSLISFIGGLAWAVASYFAIPAILFEGLGPINAVRRSSEIIKTKWGSALRVNLFAGIAFLLAWIIAVGGIFGGFYIALGDPNSYSEASLITGFSISGVTILLAFAIGLVQSSVMSYACVAIYRYAVGKPLAGFDSSLMTNAFKLKKQKFSVI